MIREMDKAFEHIKYEKKIYEKWETSGTFTPKTDKKKKSFTVIMPPPNANDPLHIGHARGEAIRDTIIRYKRMQGFETLYLPGTDHAGIETQYVFEKKLKEKGQSRFDFDRETLFNMIWKYVQENSDVSIEQMKALGVSADWSRLKFTLDPDIVKIVYKTFKKLYDDGLVYRGERIVNYCTRCGTSFSELEVNHVERDDSLYYISYGPITVATTRPETIFADSAIAVNPKDERYTKLIGKQATIPLVGRKIPIIADTLVDMTFGTGALKVTPGHDPLDFEIGQKHKLSVVSVIGEDGKMHSTPQAYIGMYANQAREAVSADLDHAHAIKKIETIHHVVGVCYRDKGLIEPMVSKQWYIQVAPLTKLALAAIKTKKTKIVVKKYEKIANHWLRNLKDWNVSRQIVWGIQIPAWRCDKCLQWTITDGSDPDSCKECGHTKLTRDKDTFDTWFSSGQWPFATLQSVSDKDYEYFYPTSLMETAYDILPFWVIRMIMLGVYVTGQVPFVDVVFHGLVRDKNGLKISKSKGNVINPLEMTDKYGTDALRMSLIWGALVENDISLSEENIRAQRNFANKIWNIARFVLTDNAIQTKKPRVLDTNDKWILSELGKTRKKISRHLDQYRLSEAAAELYDFVWKKFADVYIEKSKNRRAQAQPVLSYVLYRILILAHPFMPFVTEAIWQENKIGGLLISQSWD